MGDKLTFNKRAVVYRVISSGFRVWGLHFGSVVSRIPEAVTRRHETKKVFVPEKALATRWTSRVSWVQDFERNVTEFAPHKALRSILGDKLTFNERAVVYRVISSGFRIWGLREAGRSVVGRVPEAVTRRHEKLEGVPRYRDQRFLGGGRSGV